jgi:hypothetical protein
MKRKPTGLRRGMDRIREATVLIAKRGSQLVFDLIRWFLLQLGKAGFTGAVALAALVTAGIAWAQLCAVQHSNEIAVRPFLEIEFRWDREESAGWVLSNKGIGPARIASFKLFVAGERVDTYKAMAERLGVCGEPRITRYTIDSGQFWDVGKTEFLYRIEVPTARRLRDQIIKNHEKVSTEICYCSLYDRCWRTCDELGCWQEDVDACELEDGPKDGYDGKAGASLCGSPPETTGATKKGDKGSTNPDSEYQ